MNSLELLELVDKADSYNSTGRDYAAALMSAKSALAAPEILNSPELNFRALLASATASWHLGQRTEAFAPAKQALAIAQELDNRLFTAQAKSTLGNMYVASADYDHALEYLMEALHIDSSLGFKNRIAQDLGDIGVVYSTVSDFGRALEYLNQALGIEIELGNKRGISVRCGNIGIVYQNLSDYSRALEYFHRALAIDEELENKRGIAIRKTNIGMVHQKLSDYPLAVEYLTEALRISEELELRHITSAIIGNLGTIYQRQGDFELALGAYTRAHQIEISAGDKRNAAIQLGNIGGAYACLGEYSLAEDYYRQSLTQAEALGDKRGVAIGLGSLGELYADPRFSGYDPDKGIENLTRAVSLNEELGTLARNLDYYKSLAVLSERLERWKDANEFNKKIYSLESTIKSEEVKKRVDQLEYERLEAERDKQWSIERARAQATDEILANILPPTIVERLIKGEKKIADTHDTVSVLFVDIVGFTKISEKLPASELIDLLDDIFTRFDTICKKNGLEKIKTIGDAYMAVCGAPLAHDNHAERVARAALDMLDNDAVERVYSPNHTINFRIGLHTGSVVAGIIGENKYSYDLWGDAVNTASRMESHGEPGKIHVTEEFRKAYTIAAGQHTSITFIPRGTVEIKGKGIMNTYFMENK
ncbi:MAG: tetratricopeptide repeat protein [Ignavibacteria bacterium]|nr:tetratricopeptide repeat protein [Ignavibacteria bacterium]